MTFDEYVQGQISGGYIAENGNPLKCHYCESKNLVEKPIVEGPYTVEILVNCKVCNKKVGHWAYGVWDVI